MGKFCSATPKAARQPTRQLAWLASLGHNPALYVSATERPVTNTSATATAYYDDPYAQSLEATVTGVDGEWVTLDRTLFYPQGGGQPGDSGHFIAADGQTLTVVDTRKGEAGAI